MVSIILIFIFANTFLLTSQQIPSTSGTLGLERWRSVTARVSESELPLLHQRLKECGCDNVNQLLKAFLVRKVDKITEDQQTNRRLQTNQSSNGLKSIISGDYRYEFYKEIAEEDFRKWLIECREIEKGYADDIISYFHRFKDQFFGPHPEEMRSYSEKVRAYSLGGMRKFAEYWQWRFRTKDTDCKDLVEYIIRHNYLNAGLTHKAKIYLVDDDELQDKIMKILAIPEPYRLIVTVGLVSGLREQELEYIYRQTICSNKVGTCDCNSLHVAEKNNLTAILIMWKRGRKISYYTLMPSELWQSFRRLSHFTYFAEIRKANEKTKEAAGTLFKDLRKFHYNVLKQYVDRDAIEALHGRTSDVTARHYAFQLTGSISEGYKKAGGQHGLIF